MDKYDYLEIAYRFALFCIICIASGYILISEWCAKIISTGTGFVQYIVILIGVIIWLVFIIGVGAYLVFVAKGSFRPKNPDDSDEEDDDEDEDGLDLDTEKISYTIKENSNE